MTEPSWYTLIVGLSNLQHSDLEQGVHVQIAKAIETKSDRVEEYTVRLEDENERLKKRDEFLSALEQAGVDNWSGYSYAFEILEAN